MTEGSLDGGQCSFGCGDCQYEFNPGELQLNSRWNELQRGILLGRRVADNLVSSSLFWLRTVDNWLRSRSRTWP